MSQLARLRIGHVLPTRSPMALLQLRITVTRIAVTIRLSTNPVTQSRGAKHGLLLGLRRQVQAKCQRTMDTCHSYFRDFTESERLHPGFIRVQRECVLARVQRESPRYSPGYHPCSALGFTKAEPREGDNQGRKSAG